MKLFKQILLLLLVLSGFQSADAQTTAQINITFNPARVVDATHNAIDIVMVAGTGYVSDSTKSDGSNFNGSWETINLKWDCTSANPTLTTSDFTVVSPLPGITAGAISSLAPYTTGCTYGAGFAVAITRNSPGHDANAKPTIFCTLIYTVQASPASSGSFTIRNTVPGATTGCMARASSWSNTNITNGSSKLQIAGGNSVLPITFIGLSGTNANCSALLKWKTSSELNSSHYFIEASTDGTNFKNAMRVASKNASLGASYSATLQLESGSNFYRIKAVDFDGRITYGTNIITLKNTCAAVLKATASPNPATENITVVGLSGNNTITVVNNTGQILAKLSSTTFSKVIPVSNYPSGMYVINIVNDNGTVQHVKFVKN